MPVLDIGSPIIFIDAHFKEHNALCIHVWPDMSGEGHDGCNLVYIRRGGADDSFGEERVCETSVVHADSQPAEGLCWAWPDPLKIPDAQPEAARSVVS